MKKYLCVLCALIMCGCSSQASSSEKDENVAEISSEKASEIWEDCNYVDVANIEIPIPKECKAGDYDDWYESENGWVSYSYISVGKQFEFTNEELEELKAERLEDSSQVTSGENYTIDEVFELKLAEKTFCGRHQAFQLSGTSTSTTHIDNENPIVITSDITEIYLNAEKGYIYVNLYKDYGSTESADYFRSLVKIKE